MKKIGLLKHIKNIHLPETSRNVKNVAKHKIFRVSKELKPVFPCELCNKK